jgi:ribosomal protein S26
MVRAGASMTHCVHWSYTLGRPRVGAPRTGFRSGWRIYGLGLATGRNKPPHGRGHVRRVFCESSGALVPKDKAVKRFIVRNIVESAAIRDLQEACVYEAYQLPKLYRKVRYVSNLTHVPRFAPQPTR